MSVAKSEPDREHRSLQSRPQAVVGRRRLVLFPNEETEIVSAFHSATLFALDEEEGCMSFSNSPESSSKPPNPMTV